ncbi:2-oxoacid:acceptor oxidoreductase subunit alpha [Lepagella muris]|uniref:2-oxoacid:acceptor oxidoreductase subunit alpha n=2 Tax=Muribaculaceae TaxID=2005473 RepID=A0AC61RGW1_9BACT|nr:2-oxoacid:acceptor oxidoreductase subunit alpha [Lepagella muris]ROT03495.1 2-oxoacid:acceptor oxidoreductase subunit alpha [Muribaculaceae bacterium Isolate-037 (Harlan)]TGY77351.1 2-oxoacid:acceptor oxidoreductase subunit alpha [Lepagella muris]THG49565.1 2-oxoacid:acceptor oxidoreductase subunit alpha [Bacteroidales bacterium]TKC54712.1 2-oxoacid:acceptor oxidoreductase subunit alpha [Bacteroidales bacterium]
MLQSTNVKTIEKVVIRFAGDSGDGMQLAGNIFSNVSAGEGNLISTFPDYPAEIRAPQGSLSGVSGYQVSVGKNVHTPGDSADVLVAMNPAALKTNLKYLKPDGIIICDGDSFTPANLKKALYQTEDPITELGINPDRIMLVPMTTLLKHTLADSGMDIKAIMKCKNMLALGLLCWLLDRPVDKVLAKLKAKFAKKPAVYEANEKVIHAGWDYGHNTHASMPTYRIETEATVPGTYTDINGNTATAWGLILASEKSGRPLFLGSYPITPATDILHELAKRKDLGVKACQMEDEIAGVCSAIGASYGGHLAVTTTSGPGLALKSEGIGLAVMAELPLVVIDVQRGGPSTGLPTKTEQTDLMQALYGRNGESPLCVVAAASPTDCFTMAFEAARIAIEHMTPVILLTDAFIANGSSAWRIPEESDFPEIKPNFVSKEQLENGWKPFDRDMETLARYWAIPGTEKGMHRVGGLEKDFKTSVISTDGPNHEHMVKVRKEKIARIANDIPELQIQGNPDADTILVGWGGTYGHILTAATELNAEGIPTAVTHFRYINPLPKNALSELKKYKRVIVAELNTGMFADYLQQHLPNKEILRINKIEGQPFLVKEIADGVKKHIAEA